MKTFLFLTISLLAVKLSSGQLKTTPLCPAFDVDILEGTVNEMHPYATLAEIEKKFPCFTTATPETNGATCGGVFFKDKDIYFFTERNYIEIGEHFKGKMSLPLIGASRNGLFRVLGNPSIKDVSWDAYQTKFGILILYYNKANRINKIQFSNLSAGVIKLCQ